MKISDLVKMGLRNLLRRKARTALTVIGVIIGTISIVVMFSIGIGMNESFEKSIMQNGSMTVIDVSSNQYVENEDGSWSSTKQTLNDDVVEQLKAIEHVKAVTPILYCWSAQFYSGKYQSWPNLMVMDMDCYEEFGYPVLEDGTYPTKEEALAGTLYFGSESLNNEFYYWDGRTSKTKEFDFEHDKLEIKFSEYQQNERKKEYSFQVAQRKKISGSEGAYSEASWYTFVDIDLYKEMYQKYANTLKVDDRKKALASLSQYETIRINVDNMNNVTEVQDTIELLGYKSSSDMQYIEPMQETSEMLQIVLGAIGGIAMLVSAINIANTMIMSIYERTKEIGIMKVLGCKVVDVKKLFLFEAGLIGLIGGIIGVGLSYLASWAINTYGQDIFASLMSGSVGVAEGSDFSVIPFWLPFLAAAFAIAVGILSGYLPARRATKISAIEAMKSAE